MIASDARLTYGQAQRRDVPPEVAEELELAAEYSAELRRRRFARGALASSGRSSSSSSTGRAVSPMPAGEGEPEAHALVEELMIVANEAVAGLLAGRRREALYRVHERPDPQSVCAAAREARRARRPDAAGARSSSPPATRPQPRLRSASA